MATKEDRIFSVLEDKVDAIVLMNGTEPNLDLSFFYATGITSGILEGCLAIIRPKGIEVITSELEELSARKAGVRISVFQSEKDKERLVRKRLKEFDRIGVNSEELTHANFKYIRKCASGARIIDVSKSLEKARMTKSDDEVGRIRKACEIASRTADAIPDIIRIGQTETEAAAELNYMMMRLGAAGPSFSTNASFGSASAEPHHMPTSRRLRRGQFALFDFGASFRRYVSDITRTFVSSAPSPRQKEMYETVLHAQLAALDEIRDGVHGRDVDRAARDIVDKSRYKGRFIHGTGHGLGVCVHDPGCISSARDMILREGMVLTVEPGVYVKKFGGVRIEDDVLVTKRGCRILTSASKELIRL